MRRSVPIGNDRSADDYSAPRSPARMLVREPARENNFGEQRTGGLASGRAGPQNVNGLPGRIRENDEIQIHASADAIMAFAMSGAFKLPL